MGRVVAGVLRAALVLAGPGWVSDGLAAPGALDPSFGTGGSIVTTFGWGGDDSAARVIVRQRDGKLVAGGTGWDGEYGFALARYDRHGVLDPTFGEDGRVVTYWGHLDYHGRTITGLVEHDDGTLVAAGTLDTGGGLEIGVVRYTPEGRLDPTFGVDGRVRTILSGYDLAEDVALQPDGKIVVAGSTGYAMLLARYDRDGALDPTFGGVGWVSHDFGTYAAGRAVLVQPDGKIVIAGDTFGVEGDRLALARYLGDGTLDPTFGDGGTVLAATPSEYAEVTAMIRQPDGRLVVSGFVDSAGDDFLLARFDVDGAPDPTFGDAGVVVTAVSSSYDRAFDVTALADGRLVVVGWSYTSTSQVALTRLLADGSLDPTFGGGTVVVEFTGAFDEASDVLVDDDVLQGPHADGLVGPQDVDLGLGAPVAREHPLRPHGPPQEAHDLLTPHEVLGTAPVGGRGGLGEAGLELVPGLLVEASEVPVLEPLYGVDGEQVLEGGRLHEARR